MALKSETMGSYGRNAGEHRVRLLPNRAHRREPQRFSSRGYQFAEEIRTIAAMPHTWAVATTVVPVSELIGRDFEFEEIVGLIAAHRLMVPTVMAKTYNRAFLRLSVTIIGLRRVRLQAAPVSAAPISMLRTQVRPIAPGARWAAWPSTAVLAYLTCMGTDLGL
jgi:hypothetical protein